MPTNASPSPRHVPQIMVSSTFTDLEEHRKAIIEAIHKHKLHANVMEFDDAKLDNVIDSSLQMVRDSAAYILLVSLKYGQTPECPKKNPDKLSITELEYQEAVRLGRPILLFIMGDDHPVRKADIERDPENETKLNAFRERAKKSAPDSSVDRVYAVFNSIEEFKDKMNSPLAELDKHLATIQAPTKGEAEVSQHPSLPRDHIPSPPAFYAEPDYIGSHQFVGRQAELDALSDWANRADPTNLLLFEAIGGNGKSMLTWEWATKHATTARPDWAGRFWYSFYERGAIMQDFCQRALAYMTGRALRDFEKLKTAQMKDELIAQLHAKPWLLILDGLERVLVAYHRIDAAEVADEEANSPTDKILNRNPCDAIRDEDSDLLRALAACVPSKILVSSRLTPRVLLNSAGQPISGARRITLLGLRPPDAEALLRQCGITGSSEAIQNYLRENCDNHPLVIGILAGLIAYYLFDRGNFDSWSVDPRGGAALDLAKLNIVQRRNHILHVAMSALSDPSRQLLSTLALVSESVDYNTLAALNSRMSIEPRHAFNLSDLDGPAHKQGMLTGGASTRTKLMETVIDLERRGLLQYDAHEQRYDLHPVVRGVAVGGINVADKRRYGMGVVDHFSSLSRSPYAEAKTLEELNAGLHVVRTLLKLGYWQRAASTCGNGLLASLCFSFEAYAEMLSLLRPFFLNGWEEIPNAILISDAANLANYGAIALGYSGEFPKALVAYATALRVDLKVRNWQKLVTRLSDISLNLADQNCLAKGLRIADLAYDLAIAYGGIPEKTKIEFELFAQRKRIGHSQQIDTTGKAFDLMGWHWPREEHREGEAEYLLALSRFWQGTLTEEQLSSATALARRNEDRTALRGLERLQGTWRLEQRDYAQAISSFVEAVRMARERRLVDAESETGLVLAKFLLGRLTSDDARSEAERLAALRHPAYRYLAMLWSALGVVQQAAKHALAAYGWAWADGEPYVNRYELTQTTKLLNQLNIPKPKLKPYIRLLDEPFPWEADVQAVIEKLKTDKEIKRKKRN